jgi:ATP-dependent DNA helicase RecG
MPRLRQIRFWQTRFFDRAIIEAWGRGIEKISRECRDRDLPLPVYDFSMSGLMLTFKANAADLALAIGPPPVPPDEAIKVGDTIGGSIGGSITENQRAILSLLQSRPHLPARELAELVGISTRNVEQNITKLKALGLLQRVGGSARNGYWLVTESDHGRSH